MLDAILGLPGLKSRGRGGTQLVCRLPYSCRRPAGGSKELPRVEIRPRAVTAMRACEGVTGGVSRGDVGASAARPEVRR